MHAQSFAEAFEVVKKVKPDIRPNPGFVAQLKHYETTLIMSKEQEFVLQ
jgi:hypothetical protein